MFLEQSFVGHPKKQFLRGAVREGSQWKKIRIKHEDQIRAAMKSEGFRRSSDYSCLVLAALG